MQELASLVLDAQKGDEKAFEKIVGRFQNMAYAVAYTMLYDSGHAQDAAQEAFLDAYQNLADLREPAAFPGWFRRIVVKHGDRLIRGKRTIDLPIEAAGGITSSGLDPEAIMESVERDAEIHAAIANLPEKQRLVTILFYIQEYSLKEIAEILEMPHNNIKKYLFTARQKLKRRMIVMIADQLKETRPSKDDQFAHKVAYFIALRAGDTRRLKTLLEKSPELIEAKTEWGIASAGYYWPTGITGLHWAAGIGDEMLIKFLIAHGAEVNASSASGITPLHFAVLMRRDEILQPLIDAGAQVNAESKNGHTPLHFAVMRGDGHIARQLLEHGASLDAVDQHGRTPLDWAHLKGDKALVALFSGEKMDQTDGGSVAQVSKNISIPDRRGIKIIGSIQQSIQVDHKSSLLGGQLLETGVKIIDLLVPMRRGGQVGVFTPLPGVGKLVILGQMIHSLANHHGGVAICLGVEHGSYTAENLRLAWQEWGVGDQVMLIFAEKENDESAWERVIDVGVGVAESLRNTGREVLLIVDVPKAYPGDLLAKTTPPGEADIHKPAITRVFTGGFSIGALPNAFAGLDAAATFDVARARRSLWPAVDPLRSWSALLEKGRTGSQHVETAREVKKTFWRVVDLRVMVESGGVKSLEREEDRLSWLRAERLDSFLTQRFTGAEPWTGDPGDYVPLRDTLQGCRAILDGECDQLSEKALYFIGGLKEAYNKKN